jgi:hypothetical protein
MGKAIRTVFDIDTFSLTECTDGYWLYDSVVGMNLAMRAKTEQDAYIEALLYYQERLAEVKTDYKNLTDKVQNFVSLFVKEDEDGFLSTDIW